jgi:pimeloyl-ACP methyl ester carboxylesterase
LNWILIMIITWVLVMSIIFASGVILLRRSDRRKEKREGKKERPSIPYGEKKEGVFSLDGTPLHVDYLGESDPTIFFVHGILASGEVWRYQKPYFARKYRVVGLDLRGHGESSLPANKKDFGIEDMAGDVKATIDAFDPQQFVIAGHSMGGFITFKFFEKYGKEYEGRLKGLAILDSTGVDTNGMSLRWKLGGLFLKYLWDSPVIRVLQPHFSKSAAMYMYGRWIAYGEQAPASEVELFQKIASKLPIKTLKGTAKACMNHRMEYCLPDVNIPVLMLVGNEDCLMAKDRLNNRTCALLPDVRSKVIEGAGHNAMLELPEEVNAGLDEFLTECFAEGSGTESGQKERVGYAVSPQGEII